MTVLNLCTSTSLPISFQDSCRKLKLLLLTTRRSTKFNLYHITFRRAHAGVETLNRIADYFGLSNQKQHKNKDKDLQSLCFMLKYRSWYLEAQSIVSGAQTSDKILFDSLYCFTELLALG